MSPVLEVQSWPSNAEMIRSVLDMHVFPKCPHPRVVDVTYGRGIWWKALVDIDMQVVGQHDIRQDGVDYRNLPHPGRSVDVVFFDPDYVAPGGRDTSTVDEFNDRYGLVRDYETPATLQDSINRGIVEGFRVLDGQGVMLVKCMNYVSSGKLWLGEHWTITAGLAVGFRVEDIFVMLGKPGPQPSREGVKQQHARSNSSRLIVFRKPGRRSVR